MNTQIHNEASLIQGCKENNRKSQNKLFDTYGGYVMGVAQRYSKRSHEAKDIFLKAFELIFRNIEKFDSQRGNFKAWSKSITINVALNHLRLSKRFDFKDIEEIVEPVDEKDFSKEIDMEYVAKIVTNLKEPHGIIFNMVMDGYKHKEISQSLSITEATSRSYYMRSRKMIKDKLANLKIDLIHG